MQEKPRTLGSGDVSHERHEAQPFGGDKGHCVRAVVALLAARGIVCIKHDREKAKGQRQPSSSSSDWVTKALQWAAETASWIDAGEVDELVRLAAKNINTASNDNKAIVELGCGWEGATEGLARVFGQVVTLDKRQQLISSSRCSVDGKARYSHPSVLGDFRQPCANLVHWVRKKAGLSKDELRAVWASPSCTGHSRRQGMLKTNATTSHRAQGRFAGRPMCEEEAEATRAVFDSVWDWWSEDKANRRYCIENVESAKMDEEIERRFGRGIVVKACRFGKQSGKTHRLWLSKETEAAFLERYNDPERTPRCPYCDVRPRRKHPQSGLPRKGSGQQREHEKARPARPRRTGPGQSLPRRWPWFLLLRISRRHFSVQYIPLRVLTKVACAFEFAISESEIVTFRTNECTVS